MHIPYTKTELENLVRACIEFTDDHGQYFCANNIASRSSVVVESDEVKRMMKWVVELDKGILEYKGFGNDNIEYFRLGHDARKIMADGGFNKYLRRRNMVCALEQLRVWSPIGISLFALTVSVLAWQTPKRDTNKIDELAARLTEVQVYQAQTNSTVVTIQDKLDTVMAAVHKSPQSLTLRSSGSAQKRAAP